jgi:hypothetical protein
MGEVILTSFLRESGGMTKKKALPIFFKLLLNFHIPRIPMNDFLFKITFIAGQSGSGGSKSKSSIFHHCFTSFDGIKEIDKMV